MYICWDGFCIIPRQDTAMRITEVKLTKKQRVELEYIEHFDSRPFMQKRSRIILDKADGMPSKKIAERLSCSEHKVNRWVRRYLDRMWPNRPDSTKPALCITTALYSMGRQTLRRSPIIVLNCNCSDSLPCIIAMTKKIECISMSLI
ncbi:helix-turn-helix domain-containing protein [Paramuribaculum intestinale]|uniref:helix-turn-helix domain-containing protein n=3 Tax=Paramuribaculum intestinale TaxID=2094151 RepID=UPI00338ED26A